MFGIAFNSELKAEMRSADELDFPAFRSPYSDCFFNLRKWAIATPEIKRIDYNFRSKELIEKFADILADGDSHAVIQAPTATGKTTELPLYYASQLQKSGSSAKIMVVMPTRASTRSVAQYLMRALGDRSGRIAGYAMRCESHFTSQTSILYVTTGIAEIILSMEVKLNAVFMDEFHDRSLAVNLALHRAAQRSVRLFFMSATFPPEIKPQLEQYLKCGIAEIKVEASARKFTVKTLAARKLLSHERLSESLIDDIAEKTEILLNETEEAKIWRGKANSRVPRTEDVKLVVDIIKTLVGSSISGNILVFVNGLQDINQLFNHPAIRDLAGRRLINYHRLHSQIDWDFKAEITSNIRKVIFATNVATTGITLPEIRFVIDGCTQKLPNPFDIRGMQSLRVTEIDRSSLWQRMGRTGRQCNGFYIFLATEAVLKSINNFTHESAAKSEEPMMCILKCVDYYQTAEIPKHFFDSVPEILWQDSIHALYDLGLLNQSHQLTEIGELVAKFGDFSAEIALLILSGYAFGCLEISAAIAAVLYAPASIFAYQRDFKGTARSPYIMFRNDSAKWSDHATLAFGLYEGHELLEKLEAEITTEDGKAQRKYFNEYFSAPMLRIAWHNYARIGLSMAKIGLINIDGVEEAELPYRIRQIVSERRFNWCRGNTVFGAMNAALLCAFGQRFISKDVNTYYAIVPEETTFDEQRPIAVFYRANEFSDKVASAPFTAVTTEAYAMFGKLFGEVSFSCNTGVATIGKLAKNTAEIKLFGSTSDIRLMLNGRETIRSYFLSSFSTRYPTEQQNRFRNILRKFFADSAFTIV